jgi:hypothetical protein
MNSRSSKGLYTFSDSCLLSKGNPTGTVFADASDTQNPLFAARVARFVICFGYSSVTKTRNTYLFLLGNTLAPGRISPQWQLFSALRHTFGTDPT